MSASSPFPSDAQLQKPVCVFCGSSPGSSSIYAAAARSVGQALAKENIPLVYGGGRRGIMGVVSQSTLQANGYVHGIVPRALTGRASEHTVAPAPAKEGEGGTRDSAAKTASASASISANGRLENATSKEGQGNDLLDDDFKGRMTLEIVESMHERKLKMAQISTGGFIVLPGGYGTFEEALEMVTWNQLGIHRLPLIILNIGNFYSHLQEQFQVAVEAGFIAPQNLSLLKVVNLPGGEGANSDESGVEAWGVAAVQALKEFSFSEGTGYGLNWKKADELESGKNNTNASTAPSVSGGRTELNKVANMKPSAIFTTMRYTSPPPPRAPNGKAVSSPATIEKSVIPLWELHVERLREAHAHFAGREDAIAAAKWGQWVGDEHLWEVLREKLERTEEEGRGDWRVRMVIHPSAPSCQVEVQVIPAPAGAGPFVFTPSASRPEKHKLRPMILDPLAVELNDDVAPDLRLYKTTDRGFYDQAYERGRGRGRGGGVSPASEHPEVLLHTATHLLETTTSNIAILLPSSSTSLSPFEDGAESAIAIDKREPEEWVTPRLTSSAPFLNGVMRRDLLSRGIIKESELMLENYERAKREGRRVIGFNGLRGIWEAELV